MGDLIIFWFTLFTRKVELRWVKLEQCPGVTVWVPDGSAGNSTMGEEERSDQEARRDIWHSFVSEDQ